MRTDLVKPGEQERYELLATALPEATPKRLRAVLQLLDKVGLGGPVTLRATVEALQAYRMDCKTLVWLYTRLDKSFAGVMLVCEWLREFRERGIRTSYNQLVLVIESLGINIPPDLGPEKSGVDLTGAGLHEHFLLEQSEPFLCWLMDACETLLQQPRIKNPLLVILGVAETCFGGSLPLMHEKYLDSPEDVVGLICNSPQDRDSTEEREEDDD